MPFDMVPGYNLMLSSVLPKHLPLPLEKTVSQTKERIYLSACLDVELIKRCVCHRRCLLIWSYVFFKRKLAKNTQKQKSLLKMKRYDNGPCMSWI